MIAGTVELVAATQIHGGTRITVLSTLPCADGVHIRVEVTLYDSNHRDSRMVLSAPGDTERDLAGARNYAASYLTSTPGDGACACEAGWDPECGDRHCWGVPASPSSMPARGR